MAVPGTKLPEVNPGAALSEERAFLTAFSVNQRGAGHQCTRDMPEAGH